MLLLRSYIPSYITVHFVFFAVIPFHRSTTSVNCIGDKLPKKIRIQANAFA